MRNDFVVVGDCAEVSIGNGITTKVDIGSLAILQNYDIRWYAHFDYNRYYVYASTKGTTVKMHRYLIDAPDGLVVDHINGDSLDNQISNLRACSQLVNGHNRHSLNINNSSGVRGVSYHKASKKWRATVRVNYKQKHLGTFGCVKEAERVVTKYRESLFEKGAI